MYTTFVIRHPPQPDAANDPVSTRCIHSSMHMVAQTYTYISLHSLANRYIPYIMYYELCPVIEYISMLECRHVLVTFIITFAMILYGVSCLHDTLRFMWSVNSGLWMLPRSSRAWLITLREELLLLSCPIDSLDTIRTPDNTLHCYYDIIDTWLLLVQIPVLNGELWSISCKSCIVLLCYSLKYLLSTVNCDQYRASRALCCRATRWNTCCPRWTVINIVHCAIVQVMLLVEIPVVNGELWSILCKSCID